MIDRMFGAELFGRRVETTTGKQVGVLEDVVINTDDGRIIYFLVSAGKNVAEWPYRVDENGRIVVNTDSVRIERDRLVVNGHP